MKIRNLPDIWQQRDWSLDDFFSTGRLPLEDEMGRLAFTPALDVEEKEGHYLMSFDLPGM
jgi:HSP20 family molecular chaperone IbpA